MSSSHTLEELLHEIHENGVFEEVLEEVKEIRKDRKHISTTELYEMAYEKVIQKKFKKKS